MKASKILTGVLAVALSVVLSAGSAFAAGSKTTSVTAVNGGSGNTGSDRYIVREVTAGDDWAGIEKNTPSVAKAIEAVNAAYTDESSTTSVTKELTDELQVLANDASLPASVRDSAKQVLAQIQGKKQALTDFFDLDKTGEDVTKTADGQYLVTLNIPSITSKTTGIVALHYSDERATWELVTPTSVDTANKNATFVFKDLSPVIVLCDVNTSSTVAKISAKAPKTSEVGGAWVGFAVAAVVLAGGSWFALRKKRA